MNYHCGGQRIFVRDTHGPAIWNVIGFLHFQQPPFAQGSAHQQSRVIFVHPFNMFEVVLSIMVL